MGKMHTEFETKFLRLEVAKTMSLFLTGELTYSDIAKGWVREVRKVGLLK